MFSFLSSDRKKARRHAENWLHLARKVYHYRRDLLTGKEVAELTAASNKLHESLKSNEDPSKLRMDSERMEEVIRRYGGPYYNRSGWRENTEVLLVAAILAIGIRTYFVQPFKIPTNSMWPSYYGMTHEIFETSGEAPGAASRVLRKIFLGATRHTEAAPVDGDIRIPVVLRGEQYQLVPPVPVTARRFLVLPRQVLQYTLYVGDQPVHVRVPNDFQFDQVMRETFFPDAPSLGAGLGERFRAQDLRPVRDNLYSVGTGRDVRAGEPVVNFDLLTGDQLFVDRFSYHFVRPRIGDAFVFRTGNIETMRDQDDKYYIKRLVGQPGDTLEIDPPVLLRNGEPISGRPVFERLNTRAEPYSGYVNEGRLAAGRRVTLPDGAYFALGDNSPNSADSRSFGPVPEREIVGRALFIYYPFTRRWGPSQ